MTEYLKMMPLLSWWQQLDLNELSISELFEDLLSWNFESKLITPKNITGTYFGVIMAIFDFSFSVFFLYVMFFLTPERAPKAGPVNCYLYASNHCIAIIKLFYMVYNFEYTDFQVNISK